LINSNKLQSSPPGSGINNKTPAIVATSNVVDCSKRDNTDSKTTDNNLTEVCNLSDSIVSIAKKKRVRKRKPKNRSQSFIITPDTTEKDIAKELKSKKPKVIYSYKIPPEQRLRFVNIENDDSPKLDISKNESCLSKASSSRDPSTF